jgi:large subunit GTPase 1
LDSHGVEYNPNQQHVKWSDQNPEQKGPQFTFEELSVPRRPKWDANTTPEELDQLENETFLQWRRAIAAKEEQLYANTPDTVHAYNAKTVTPYEKNLQVWRQLWRVLERCSCVVQLVDGRNPMFYLSEDLRKYAEELGKPMMLVVNKSDYLSREQRKLWSQYFDEGGLEHVFFSAHQEQAKLDKAAQLEAERLDRLEQEDGIVVDENDLDDDDEEENSDGENSVRASETADQQEGESPEEPVPPSDAGQTRNNGVDVLLSREELTNWMHDFAREHDCKPNPRYENRLEFGTVGFPNVGT